MPGFPNAQNLARGGTVPLFKLVFCLFALATLALSADASPPKLRKPLATGEKTVSFQREILPILVRSCVSCHNPQAAASGCDLTTFSAMMKGGNRGVSVVPFKSATSLLYRYLVREIAPAMPLGGALKPAEIALFRRWIDAGAKSDSVARGDTPEPERKTSGFGSVRSEVAPPVTSLAFSPNQKWLLVGTYRQIQYWNLETGARERILKGASENVTALAFSPDGKTLAAAGGIPTEKGEVLLYDLETGRLLQTLNQHSDIVYALDFTKDGKRLVTASGDKTLRLWNLSTGETIKTMKEHADSVYAVKCAPDGTRIVSTGVDRSLKVWDALTGKPLFSFSGRAHNDTAYALAFSPDGKRMLTSGGDKTAKLWTLGVDAESSKEFRQLQEHDKAVFTAVFSPDGSMIATGSADKTVSLWSGVGGGHLRTLTGAKDWVYAVAFAPDSRYVVAGTYDGELLLWRTEDGVLLKRFSTRPNALRLASVTAPQEAKKERTKMNEPVKVADGFVFPEGPAYDGKGAVYVSNCNADYISKLNGDGKSLSHKRSEDRFTFEKTNGMTFYEDGSLFACDFGRNSIIQIFPDGRMETYSDKFENVGFKGPNDLAFDPEGNLYFSDPAGSDIKNPIGCVYRVAKGSRKVTKVADGMAFPNGVAFSADAKWLYIAESGTFKILRAAVKPDGGLEKPELFCQLPKDHVPDGMNFDEAGSLYVATVGPGLVTVIDKTGAITRTIKLPGTDVTNVEFAGKDLKTLYITEAQKGEVYKLTVDIGGLPLFRAPKNEVK